MVQMIVLSLSLFVLVGITVIKTIKLPSVAEETINNKLNKSLLVLQVNSFMAINKQMNSEESQSY